MMTIEEALRLFNLHAVPQNAGATQRREMHRAFLAGMIGLFAILEEIDGIEEEEEGIEALDRVWNELVAVSTKYGLEIVREKDEASELEYIRGNKHDSN